MPQTKKIVFTVINDLNYDQRMQRICGAMHKAGYEVTLIGRTHSKSKELKEQAFKQKRLNLFFEKGKLFYLEYNIRLFFLLLFSNYDIYSATDLDTAMPQCVVAKLKGKTFAYDAHEYFPELPEIIHRPFTHWVWCQVEKFIVPRADIAYTINQSYADVFMAKYRKKFGIVRNATVLQDLPDKSELTPPEKPYILYQGAVNVGRGIEEMIQAMPMIKDLDLYICGKGDVYEDCVRLVEELDLKDRVTFFGFVPPEELRRYTLNATLGFTFFTNDGLSYYLSLANRFFDYFHAGVPQLVTAYPEYKRINAQYEIAVLLKELAPQSIAEEVNSLVENKGRYQALRTNTLKARTNINWQGEEVSLLSYYQV